MDSLTGLVWIEGQWQELAVTLKSLADEAEAYIAIFTCLQAREFSPLESLAKSALLYGCGLVLGLAGAMLGKEMQRISN